MTDKDIDYSDIPELDESFFTHPTVEISTSKDTITLRVDHETLEWFKQQGRGYQTRINAVLRSYVKAHQPHARGK